MVDKGSITVKGKALAQTFTPEISKPTFLVRKMRGKTILLVDDESHITQLLTFRLQQQGAIVHVGDDGAHGFELALELRPDLIVSDLQMPVLNGYDMCVKLAAEPHAKDIPVIMLTARGHKLSDEELAKTNIKRLMSKPFSARELITAAELILEDATSSTKDQAA